MFERKGDKLLSRPQFVRRMALSFACALAIVAFGLVLGTVGYHYIASLRWIDALLNSAMILTGMGPVDPMHDTAAKLFASGFALFSGVTFVTSLGIVLTPVVHRVVHKFHLDSDR